MQNTAASVFNNVKSIHPEGTNTLYDLCTSPFHREEVLLLRQFEKGSEEYKTIKQNLTCFTPSITCTQRGANYMTAHTGFVCLDWDYVDDPEDLKAKLASLSFISFCALSCSGRGVYALVRIAHPNLHRQHYEALLEYFARVGLPADPACKDLSRLRIMSYDPKYYYNEEADTWTKALLPKPIAQRTQPSPQYGNNINERAIYAIRDYIVANGVDITSGRNYWLALGTFIAKTIGESAGKSVFRDISQFHPKFNETECEKAYNTASIYGNHHSLGVLLNACKRAGIPDLTELLTSKK